jgi:DNA-binding PadR family transcriptional regulator
MATTDDTVDLSELNEKAREILVAVDSEPEPASTTTIRGHTDLPNDDIWYHARTLIRHGYLIETAASKADDSLEPNVYRITDSGERAVAAYNDSPDLTVEGRVAKLESDVTTLQAENEALREQLQATDDRIDAMKERLRSEEFLNWLRERL